MPATAWSTDTRRKGLEPDGSYIVQVIGAPNHLASQGYSAFDSLLWIQATHRSRRHVPNGHVLADVSSPLPAKEAGNVRGALVPGQPRDDRPTVDDHAKVSGTDPGVSQPGRDWRLPGAKSLRGPGILFHVGESVELPRLVLPGGSDVQTVGLGQLVRRVP